MDPHPPLARRTVKAACPHDCPDTCAMEITVEDGVAIEVRGGAMPFTGGTLCTKVARYLDRTYSPDRVLHPLRRIGPKGPGRGRWERIDWDTALDTIADRYRSISADDPQGILPYSYAGTMGMVSYASMDRRFFHRLGASLLERTICSSAGGAGIALTLGGSVGMDPEEVENARLIVIWGSNPIVSNLHFWSRCQEAKRRGARLVIIDPWRNQTAAKCHQWIPIMPGTDAAFALAVMNVIITEGRHDEDYVARHTLGFDALAERVDAWPPERAAPVCGVDAGVIRAFAREYATTRPSAIRINYGLQRHYGGGMAVRTIACLPALVGAWRHPAGGLLLGTSGFYALDHAALERPDLIRGNPRKVNMSAIGDALLQADPPIRAIHVYNSNPVAVAPDSNRVIAGFSREDLFTVVHDVFLTDTTDYADLVLPATTQLEQFDIHKSYGHLYMLANNPAIAPVGESRTNAEVFRQLASRLDFREPCFLDDDETIARQALGRRHPHMTGLDWDTLRNEGWQRLNVPRHWAPFADGGFPTPSGKCEFFSERARAAGLDPLPDYTPPLENRLSNVQLAARYPLAFLSPPARHFLNTSFANLPFALAAEQAPRLEIHPGDAVPRGISDGTAVRVFNDRGSITLRARITEDARPGVVVTPSIWWRKLSPDGRNANDLTSQALTDVGGGATFYDCLVEVAPA
ncbi:MAG: molybdopterin oxidoreductase family protein [Betaproteobacteria bacterium]